jgi:hypothetical protein
MRLVAPLVIVALLGLLAGCGGSDGTGAETTGGTGRAEAPAGAQARECSSGRSGVESLRATNVGCAEARRVAAGWRRAKECDKYGGDLRTGCSLLSYRCAATATGKGWSVSCSKPGRSIAFRFRRG